MSKKIFYVLMISIVSFVQAQEKKIVGVVSDVSGTLPGVSILIKGTTNGTETDFDGKYSIKANVGEILVYSYLGYKRVEKTVRTSEKIHVIMEEDTNVLGEIVVTSLGVSRSKKPLGYSIASVLRASGIRIESAGSEGIQLKNSQSGQLTAGEINDLEKWDEWLKLSKSTEFIEVVNNWELTVGSKVEVFVFDKFKKPINNAEVVFLDSKNKIVSKTKTDIFGKSVVFKVKGESDFYTIQVLYKNQIKGLKITSNHNRVNFVFENREELKGVDVMFAIDATGSMGDEIDYLKSEIENIISRIDKKIAKKRIAMTFYRDKGDQYVTKDFDFTTDIKEVKKNLSQQYASGGGDYEEAVEKALKVSLSKSWNEKAKARLLFLLLDAPPHLTQENIIIIKNQIKKAKKMGIKIIPIVASDANKTVEFLMRNFSVATNGTYVFLTDDSGIGNAHLKPSVDSFKLEKLNDLIVRLIEKYSGV